MTKLTATNLQAQIIEIFTLTPRLFIAEKSAGLDGYYQVLFTDIDFPWYTQIQASSCTTHQGMATDPTVVMMISTTDFIEIIHGRLKETLALMTGRLKLEGNLVLAVKYSKIFRKLG